MVVSSTCLVIIGVLLYTCKFVSAQVDGGWSNWSELTPLPCNASCGAEQQGYRTRQCNNPESAGGGKPCPGYPFQFVGLGVQCAADVCPAPINGAWSAWTEWQVPGSCDVTCGGGLVERSRSRQCNNPSRQYGGTDCPGYPFEVQDIPCALNPCPVPIDGAWSRWTEWMVTKSCDVTCGGGMSERARFRECNNPSRQHGGADCPGNGFEVGNVVCAITPCPVPIDGAWSAWTQWVVTKSCDVTCGGGVEERSRSRQCNNPSRQHGGADCSGYPFQTDENACAANACPVTGGWSDWSPWITLPCPVTCGGAVGNRTRTRVCTGSADTCPGSASMLQSFPCGTGICSAWSPWGEWGPLVCSATCGGSVTGTVTRTRTCTGPGGVDTVCVGMRENTQTLDCNLADCPDPGPGPKWYSPLPEEGRRAIIGIVIAIGIVLLLLIILLCVLRRQKKRPPTPIQPTLKEGLKSGTASGSRFREGRWNRAFQDTRNS